PTGEIINGMKVFRLIKDNGDPIISEILNEDLSDTETFDTIKNAQLLRGINQWKREKTYAPFKGEIPLNSKWNEIYRHHPENVHIDYLPIGNILSLTDEKDGKRDNFFRFTTCIFVEENARYPLSIPVIQTLPSGIRKRLGTYSIYVNQKRQKTIHDECELHLESGWNEIVILYH